MVIGMAVRRSPLGFSRPALRPFSSDSDYLLAVLLTQNSNLQVVPKFQSNGSVIVDCLRFLQVVPIPLVFPWYSGMRSVQKLKDSSIRRATRVFELAWLHLRLIRRILRHIYFKLINSSYIGCAKCLCSVRKNRENERINFLC